MSQDATGAGWAAWPGELEPSANYDNFTDSIFARRLKEIRTMAGVTQQQLADRLKDHGVKMHRSAIAKIEAGDRPVTIGEAVQIAGQLGTTLMDLATDMRSDSPAERKHRQRVEAAVLVRSLKHQAAEYHKLIEENRLLYENTVDRMHAAERRLTELGGELPWAPDPIESTLAAASRPLTPEEK